MDRAAALDRTGELFELGGEDLKLGGKRLAVDLADFLGGIEQRFEHHGDARQDRLLDPVERLFKACLLLRYGHCRNMPWQQLSLGETRRTFWAVSEKRRWQSR